MLSIKKIVEILEKKPWTKNPYKKQNWGHSFHSIAPYIGRIKPGFAHWLIKTTTHLDDVVLDPFCGIGTIPLEVDLLGRRAIGFDLNDYALTITNAKFDRSTLEDNLTWLDNIKLKPKNVKLSLISNYIKQFYHPRTLQEIVSLRDAIIRDKRDFLLGCLLGISHGHRPQYLSAWTGYIIPFSSRAKPEYREVIPRIKTKIKRMHKTTIHKNNQKIIKKRIATKTRLNNNSVDVVISSPPYYDTIDYVTSNRLRLSFLGIDGDSAVKLKEKLIQKSGTYLQEMEFVGIEMHRILKPNSLCVFVLGDVHKPKGSINTASQISKLYSTLGFKTCAIIKDEIPLARRTTNKWKGSEKLRKTRRKLDRILIMKVQK